MTIQKPHGTGFVFSIFAGVFLSAGAELHAQFQDRNAIDTGWYGNTGFHGPTNTGYLTGWAAGLPYRGFHVYDFSSPSPGTIYGASLFIWNPSAGPGTCGYVGDAFENLLFFDVSTPIPSLVAGTGGVAAYNDLGSGVNFTGTSVSLASNSSYVGVSLTLSSAALTELNAANSSLGQWAVGTAITTIGGANDQYVFGCAGGGASCPTCSILRVFYTVPPVVNAGPDQSSIEGDLVSLAPATFTDVNIGDTHTATVDWGDGAGPVAALVDQSLDTVSANHHYADNGVYLVTVRVTDNYGEFNTDTLTVTVSNRAPTVSSGPDRQVAVGSTIELASTDFLLNGVLIVAVTDAATFGDPGFDNPAGGTSETFVAHVDWNNDGVFEDMGTVLVTQGTAGVPTAGTVTASHVYGSPGLYTVAVRVIDDNGGTGTDSFNLNVINDCNDNGIPDELDPDCNLNGQPDDCEAAPDCNDNAQIDPCDLAQGVSADCDLNGIPDECESPDCPAELVAFDVNGGGTFSDSTDYQLVASSAQHAGVGMITSADYSMYNGFWHLITPVESPPPDLVWNSDPGAASRGTRSLSISTAAATATGDSESAAIRIEMLDLQNPNPANPPCCPPPNFGAYESATCAAVGEANDCARWLGPPVSIRESQDNLGMGTFLASRLQCTPYYTDWTTLGAIKVFGPEIMPSSMFELTAYGSSCKGLEESCNNVSAPVQALTRRSGDVSPPYAPTGTQPEPQDVVASLSKFKSLPGSPSKAIAQIQPNTIELNIDLGALDIVATIDAFRGLAYPYSGPCPCPSLVTCNATACSSTVPCAGGLLCVRTCTGGGNANQPCLADQHCPDGTCPLGGFCRDRCGRCH